MRKAWKRWLCAAFTLVLAAGLACPFAAPAYAAGEMEILDMTGSQWLYDGPYDHAVIASGTDFADALGGPALISDETVERIMNKETGE